MSEEFSLKDDEKWEIETHKNNHGTVEVHWLWGKPSPKRGNRWCVGKVMGYTDSPCIAYVLGYYGEIREMEVFTYKTVGIKLAKEWLEKRCKNKI